MQETKGIEVVWEGQEINIDVMIVEDCHDGITEKFVLWKFEWEQSCNFRSLGTSFATEVEPEEMYLQVKQDVIRELNASWNKTLYRFPDPGILHIEAKSKIVGGHSVAI